MEQHSFIAEKKSRMRRNNQRGRNIISAEFQNIYGGDEECNDLVDCFVYLSLVPLFDASLMLFYLLCNSGDGWFGF